MFSGAFIGFSHADNVSPTLDSSPWIQAVIKNLIFDAAFEASNRGKTIEHEQFVLDGFSRENIVVATSDEIQRAYETNMVSANQKFNGKWIFVKGQIMKTAKTKNGEVMMQLKGGHSRDRDLLAIADLQNKAASLFKAGENATMFCSGTAFKAGSAILTSCLDNFDAAQKIAEQYSKTLNLNDVVQRNNLKEINFLTIATNISNALPVSNVCTMDRIGFMDIKCSDLVRKTKIELDSRASN